jgi:cell division protein FtsW
MYFLANTPFWHTALILLIGLSSLIALIKIAPYRLERLTVFLNPGIDPMGIGFQVQQALIAVGSGGILGAGLGMGIQKFGFLPGVINDSIFAVLAEEAGFVGSIILIFLFLIFFWRGFRIAKLSQDKFSELTAYGITSWIIIQAFVNISSILGLLPLTGVPLPFISHGGTALITTLIGAGILLNISKKIQ